MVAKDNYTPEQREARKALASELVRLAEVCKRVPRTHSSWSARTAMDFKDEIAKGLKMSRASNANLEAVRSQITTINNFHR